MLPLSCLEAGTMHVLNCLAMLCHTTIALSQTSVEREADTAMAGRIGAHRVAEMVVPGAMMSGLMRLSVVGPMLVKYARLSNRSASRKCGDAVLTL